MKLILGETLQSLKFVPISINLFHCLFEKSRISEFFVRKRVRLGTQLCFGYVLKVMVDGWLQIKLLDLQDTKIAGTAELGGQGRHLPTQF